MIYQYFTDNRYGYGSYTLIYGINGKLVGTFKSIINEDELKLVYGNMVRLETTLVLSWDENHYLLEKGIAW